MKVLLVKPNMLAHINTRLPESVNKAQGAYPPLGLAYIAAVLEKQGYEVRIVDCEVPFTSIKAYKRIVSAYSPDVVGITAMTPTLYAAVDVAAATKEVGKDIQTVVGGPHLNIYPNETLKYNPSFDFGVLGEGEVVLPELLESISGNKSFRRINGLAFRENDRTYYTYPKRYVKDLDSLPFPARHLLPIKKYKSVLAPTPFTTFITSRGCPFNCHFCYKSSVNRILRFRSPKLVVDEIVECQEKYGIKYAWFYDDTFTVNHKHVKDFCNEMINRKVDISWETPTRLDVLNKDLLNLMREAGCSRLRLGVESGSQRILDLMNKNLKLRKISKNLRLVKNAGIETFCFFMLGYLSETTEEMFNTIDYSKNWFVDWAMYSPTVPYPDTQLYHDVLNQGVFDKDYWLEFVKGNRFLKIPFLHENVEKLTEKAYRSFYFRLEFLFKQLGVLQNPSEILKYLHGFYALLRFKMFSAGG